MIEVAKALGLILSHATRLPACAAELDDALGRVLDETITSPMDSPPYDKSIVDGYAIIADDLKQGAAQLEIIEEVVAGSVPRQQVVHGAAIRVMTGAPIPAGADTVVMVERTEISGGGQAIAPGRGQAQTNANLGQVVIRDEEIRAGRNILRQGEAMRTGDIVLRAGARIRPLEIALLAEIGRATVQAVPRPRVAILATGNELVAASETPAPGQIRNSNSPMLAAVARQAGATPILLGVARDDPREMAERIRQGLAADILLLSGGVSAGVMDLVPSVLAEQGVREVFHKVRLKPGKPLWFGVGPDGAAAGRAGKPPALVFGLPGNPVSTFVCFELFVRPAIQQLAGLEATGLRQCQAVLSAEHRQRGDRPTYFPAVYKAASAGGKSAGAVTPVDWHGSADLRGLSAANALALFPPGDRKFQPGETVDVLLLDA
jgi:molybdopterin molybdotransferase